MEGLLSLLAYLPFLPLSPKDPWGGGPPCPGPGAPASTLTGVPPAGVWCPGSRNAVFFTWVCFLLFSILYLQSTATKLESCWVECAYRYSWEGGTELVLNDLQAERKWGREEGNWAEKNTSERIHQEIMYNSKRAPCFIFKYSERLIKLISQLYEDTEWFVCEVIQQWLW